MNQDDKELEDQKAAVTAIKQQKGRVRLRADQAQRAESSHTRYGDEFRRIKSSGKAKGNRQIVIEVARIFKVNERTVYRALEKDKNL